MRLKAEGTQLRGGQPGESWVFLTAPGPMTIKGKKGVHEVELPPAYWQRVASETNRALEQMRRRALPGSTPYTFPVTREHFQIGRREGDILKARYGTALGKTGLWVLIKWIPKTWSDIRAKRVQHVSLGVSPKWTDDAGHTYGPLLWEMAITTHPVNKSIGTIQDTLALRWSEIGGTMDPEMMQTLLEAIGEMLAQHRAAMLEDLKMLLDSEPEDEPVEEPEAPVEDAPDEPVEQMEEPVKQMEDPIEQAEPNPLEAKVDALSAQLEQLLKGKGLNFSERSSADFRTPGARPGKPTLEEIKKKTGLEGQAAITAWRKACSGK